ncbi:hypothetical protein AABB24_034655 [Solanum stoloniferum]|uniref:Uncharacterized protein n=1 Tax=Solanum stoloniferum TaxID=62892 RepID=A0ABD2RJ92_9SOLN
MKGIWISRSLRLPHLGDWICRLLRNSERVLSSRNGSKNVPPELLLDGFQNLKDIHLDGCDSLTHLLKIHCQQNIMFPKLNDYMYIIVIVYNIFTCLSSTRSSLKLEDLR